MGPIFRGFFTGTRHLSRAENHLSPWRLTLTIRPCTACPRCVITTFSPYPLFKGMASFSQASFLCYWQL